MRTKFHSRIKLTTQVQDCENGEDEKSMPAEEIKLVQGNELFKISELPISWAISFEAMPTGIYSFGESSVFSFSPRNKPEISTPAVYVKANSTSLRLCNSMTDTTRYLIYTFVIIYQLRDAL